MSKVVRVQTGDYKVITGPAGTITLDANVISPTPEKPSGWTGGVIINGNLLVNGTTTVIESQTLSVKDNIIYINEGEEGPGVTLNTAGIQIDRGLETDVSFLWDERLGAFVLVDAEYLEPSDLSDSSLPLGTRSIITGGSNLTLIGPNLSGAGPLEGVVDVIGTVDYEEKIINYSLINAVFEIIKIGKNGDIVELEVSTAHGLTTGDYVNVNCLAFPQLSTGTDPVEVTRISDTIIQYTKLGLINFNISPAQSFFAGLAGTVRPLSIRNDDYIPNMKAVVDYTASALTSFITNYIQQGDSRVIVTDSGLLDDYGNPQISQIRFDIDGINQATINRNGLIVDQIQINENTIKNSNPSLDNILIDSVLELKTKLGEPPSTPDYVSIYSKSLPGPRGTGLYFVNTDGKRDELISKTKALLYSIIL